MSKIYIGIYDSPVGKIKITSDDNYITEISFLRQEESTEETNPSVLCDKANIQLKEYFNKSRKSFDLPIKIAGTDFEKDIYRELLKIPYGEFRSYKDIALLINKPLSSRAVGNAVGKNSIPIIIPCHRVIHSNGNINGFSCGNDIKRFLINIEKN